MTCTLITYKKRNALINSHLSSVRSISADTSCDIVFKYQFNQNFVYL